MFFRDPNYGIRLPRRVPRFTTFGRMVLKTSPTRRWKIEASYYRHISDSWEEHAYNTINVDKATACRHP